MLPWMIDPIYYILYRPVTTLSTSVGASGMDAVVMLILPQSWSSKRSLRILGASTTALNDFTGPSHASKRLFPR